MNVPSGLHETVLLKTFARKLICFASPPAAGTNNTFVDDLPLVEVNAIHLLSGDQTNARLELSGGRLNAPLASSRSCFESRSITRSSRASRSNASHFPSGEKLGAASPAASRVSCVSVFDVKSYRSE